MIKNIGPLLKTIHFEQLNKFTFLRRSKFLIAFIRLVLGVTIDESIF